MAGTSGCRLVPGRRSSSRNTSRWQSKPASIRRTARAEQYDGWLRKFTIAPQIGAGRKFFSRPVLRAFLTYADWSDGFRGLVGGPAYLKKNGWLDLWGSGRDMVVEKRDMATQETSSIKTTQAMSMEPANKNYSRPLAIVTTLFFMWGFLTCLNDILVPHLKSIFDLSYARVMLIQFAFFSAYFLFSLPWSRIVNAIGYQRDYGSRPFDHGCRSVPVLPAASTVSYPLFLTALMVLAAGITGLQVAANPYVVVLGKPETASSRLDLTQAFNSLGTTVAPKLGGLLILSCGAARHGQVRQLTPQALQAYRVSEAASVKLPYMVIGAGAVAVGRR